MMSPAAITNTGRGPTLATGGPYSPECVEGGILRTSALRSSKKFVWLAGSSD